MVIFKNASLFSAHRWFFIFCGYSYAWIVFGNVTGHLWIAVNHLWIGPQDADACTLHWHMSGMFGTMDDCTNELVNLAIFIFFSLPRFLASPTYISIWLLKSPSQFWDGVIWMVGSVPFLIMAYAGFRYWHRKSALIAYGISMPLAVILFGTGLKIPGFQ
ncbi:MAG: hypothetical protein J0L97_00800 [Alphaproteobacteria bacterium]|nr:hypothetical protein [Alphaproteobacteria bacterium]